MKFACDKNVFKKAMATLVKITGKDTNDVEVAFFGNEVRLRVWGMFAFVKAWGEARIPAVGEDSGTFVVRDAKKLNAFVRALRSCRDLEFSFDDDSLLLAAQGCEARFGIARQTIPYADSERVDGVTVSRDDFTRLVVSTGYAAMGRDGSRDVFKGIRFAMAGDELEAAALDGFRLAVCRVPAKGALGSPLVVHKDLLSKIAKVFPKNCDVEIGTRKDGNGFVSGGGLRFVFQPLEGEFLDLGKIVPQNHEMEIVASRERLLEIATLACNLAEDEDRKVLLDIRPGQIIAGCFSSSQRAPYSRVADMEVAGGDCLVLLLNGGFLKGALGAMEGETVTIGFEKLECLSACHIRDGKGTEAVILPITLPEGSGRNGAHMRLA